MSITLADALTSAQDDLDEISGRTFSLPRLRRWANRTTEDISRRTLWKRSSSDVAVSADTQTYNLPADCLEIHTAGYTQTGSSSRWDLTYLDKQNVEAEAGVAVAQARGNPHFFYTWGAPGTTSHKINLYPTPSSDGTVDVDYFATATQLETDGTDDAVVCDVPNGYDDLLILGIVYRAMQSDGDGQWTGYKEQYDDTLKTLDDMAIRFSSQAGMIMSGSGRGIPSWLAHGSDSGWGW